LRPKKGKPVPGGDTISQTGAVMGTAAYLAPEQAAGKVRDRGSEYRLLKKIIRVPARGHARK
jgi:hypothetical protein